MDTNVKEVGMPKFRSERIFLRTLSTTCSYHYLEQFWLMLEMMSFCQVWY